MKKCLKFFIKNPAFISAIGVMLSVFLAIISTCNANRVFEYTKKLNKASVSLLSTELEEIQSSRDSICIEFKFHISNTGNEPLTIINASYALFHFKDNTFEEIEGQDSSVNQQNPGALFNFTIIIPTIYFDKPYNPRPKLQHNISVMIKIDYSTRTDTETSRYYVMCDKNLDIHLLSSDNYDLMEPFLPKGFRLDTRK